MSFCLIPDVILNSLTELTPELLSARGISFLMMDFDNTIVPYTTDVPTEKMLAWLETMKASKVKIAIVSNSKNTRLIRFCETYGLDYIRKAYKPRPTGLKECMARFHFLPEESALVGDQIFTDIVAANLAGVTPILVDAIHNHTFWLKARGALELPFRFLARKRRLKT
mgnify:CR=1 FL=1